MLKIGIICPSEIAFRRFLPALQKCKQYEYCGVAVASEEEWFGCDWKNVSPEIRKHTMKNEYQKAEKFLNEYGGKIFKSYEELLDSHEINAVYIPLPPALHYKWAKKALESGKHVLVEKPSTTSGIDTAELIRIAKEKKLALHENYMFAFHTQLKEIKEVIDKGILGDVRMYRISFGFPRRASNDFRYSKKLGGGALLDCGGYTLKYASMLLGPTAKIDYARLNYLDEFDVDIYGSAALSNQNGTSVQIAFGMDNDYKCSLEVWGSIAQLESGRVLTAPAGYEPSYTLVRNQKKEEHKLSADDTFYKSLQFFSSCIDSDEVRVNSYDKIQKQANLVDEFYKKAEK